MSKNKFLAQYGDSGHIEQALGNNDQFLEQSALRNPNISPEQFEKYHKSPNVYHRIGLAQNPSLSYEQMGKLLDDPRDDVRMELSPKASKKEHIDKLINDRSDWTIHSLAGNKNMSFEQAKKAHENLGKMKSNFQDAFKNNVKNLLNYDLDSETK